MIRIKICWTDRDHEEHNGDVLEEYHGHNHKQGEGGNQDDG